MWNDLIQAVRQQQDCLDMLSAAWMTEYSAAGGRIFCGRGCRGCCSLVVNTTSAEAVRIASVLTEQQAEAVRLHVDRLRQTMTVGMKLKEYLGMHRREIGFCPLLGADGACSSYAVRPLSCRSLLSTKESRWCSEDFSLLPAAEKQDFLESLERSAVAFPTHYVASTQEMAREMEERANRLMIEHFGFALYGNMTVLVHLAREHDLTDACSAGKKAVSSLISSLGLDHHFLMNIE